MTCVVRCHEAEVADRLVQMGLTAKVLRDAIQAGELARRSCSAFVPRTFPGYAAWAHTVEELRLGLRPLGWQAREEHNFSTVVSPNGTIAIAVATGDDGTGQSAGTPRTKSTKGPVVLARIEYNYSFSFMKPAETPPPVRGGEAATWFLLFHPLGDLLHCELSLPFAVGEDERIAEWSERIVLEPIAMNGNQVVIPVEELPEIVVPVVRRTPRPPDGSPASPPTDPNPPKEK